MKYIRTAEHGFIIFSPMTNHADMAKLVGGKLISAGFVHAKRDAVGECAYQIVGRSLSLDLGQAKDDAEVLNRHASL